MKFNIVSKDIKATEGMKAHIVDKLGFLDKFLEEGQVVDVTLSKEGSNSYEITVLFVYDGKTIKISEEGDDYYVSADVLKDRIKEDITKRKEIKTQREREESRSLRSLSRKTVEIEREEARKESEKKVVKRKEFTLKPMFIEDAVLEMNSLGHDFFIYKDAEDLKDYIVYKEDEKKHEVTKEMYEDEAIIELEEKKLLSIPYIDMEDDTSSVLYKRKDGHYGVIKTL